jgi:hypothetical protein
MAKGQRALLPPEDEEQLKQLSATGSDALRQRAQAILAWHEGLTANETAKRTRLSVNQVQYLWTKYRRKGLELFLSETEATLTGEATKVAPVVTAPPVPEPVDNTITIEALCADYKVDLPHARHVGALSQQIFDATQNIHRLPQNLRPLLDAAAMVHNIAYDIDPPNHHLRGRDIVLAQPIRGFSDDERRILACTTSFHRKKVRPQAEPVYAELPEELKRDALVLAAIMRIGDGLDHSQTQTTRITNVEVTPGEVNIVVEGPHAASDADQSQKKSDLWAQIFPIRMRVGPAPSTEPTAMPLRELKATPTVNSTMSVTRVGRTFAMHTLNRIDVMVKALRSNDFSVLPTLSREASRLGEALTLADTKDFRKEAKTFANAVDDALIKFMLAERAAAIADEGGEYASLISQRAVGWIAEARAAVRAIDVARFQKMAEELRIALVEDPDPNEKALVSFHVGPILWSQLAALRTTMEHGTSVVEALELVRRLQDHLAAFDDLLGPEVSQVLDIINPLEGYLNAIHTTQEVMVRLEPAPEKKPRGRSKKTAPPPVDLALETVRNAQVAALEALADDLPAVWGSVSSSVFRRAFALAIAQP